MNHFIYYFLVFLKKEKITLVSALCYTTCFFFLKHYPIAYLPDKMGQLTLHWKVVTGLFYAPLLFGAAWAHIFHKVSYKIWGHFLEIARGFLLYDAILLMLYSGEIASSKQLLLITLLHHLIIFVATYYRRYDALLAQGFLSELTIPLLYYVWYLGKWGLTQTAFFSFLAMSTLSLFLVLRVVSFSYFLVYLVIKKNSFSGKRDVLAILGMSLLTVMNYYWFYCLALKISRY